MWGVLDRVMGGLLGVAAGDALGATVEFCSAERIAAEHGVHAEIVGGGMFGWRPGQGTDDTDLTAAVARAYAVGYDLDEVARGFLDWYAGRPRDIGGLTARALGWLFEHRDPRRSGAAVTSGDDAGNGSLMRAIATALARGDAATRAAEAAEISAVTHSDQRCVEACQVYVEIAAGLVDGLSVPDALAAAAPLARHPEVVAALRTDPERPVHTLSTSGYVIHSLAAAVWAVRQQDTLEDLVVAVVNRGDDADTTGAVVGGLLGTRDGAGAIPDRWLRRLEYRAEFTELARTLVARRSSDPHPVDRS